MNKKQLIDAVADRACVSKTTAAAVLDALVEKIQTTVATGEKVGITGFGSFERADHPARQGHNPATGQAIQIPARSVPKFKPGTDFKTRVATGARVASGS